LLGQREERWAQVESEAVTPIDGELSTNLWKSLADRYVMTAGSQTNRGAQTTYTAANDDDSTS
jgi:hypothetical protein